MDDPAANALLKTLEEPPALRRAAAAHRPPEPGAADDRLALPARPLRRAGARRSSPSGWQRRGAAPPQAEAAARLALGDGERALALATGDGAALRAHAEAFARAPLHGKRRAAAGPRCSRSPAPAAPPPARRTRRGSPRSSQFLPKKEHKRRETELGEEGRRAERRARTGALDHGLQLAGLWYRDLLCVAAGAPELAHHADRAEELAADAEGRSPPRCAPRSRSSTTSARG